MVGRLVEFLDSWKVGRLDIWMIGSWKVGRLDIWMVGGWKVGWLECWKGRWLDGWLVK